MEETNKKISFLKRIKIAIFKLEHYGFFLGEKFNVAMKYFLLLLLILSVVMSLVDTYSLNKMAQKAYQYVQNELPEFSYQEGILEFNQIVEAYDSDYGFRLFINTEEEVSQEILNQYKNKIYDDENGVIALKDKFIYVLDGSEIEYNYKEILEQSSLQIKNEKDLRNIFSESGIPTLSTAFFVIDLIMLYISNFLTIFSDLILIALFGLIAARFCGLRFKIAPMFSLSIYALTLSVVLTAIYSVVYGLTGFVINYFDVMYLLIAYIYIIAAILMIKYDLIKEHFELEKILEVQKQVHEELQEKQDKEKEETKESNEEKNKESEDSENKVEETDSNNREPDGSEI